MMTESILVGLVVGGGVALVGALIGHFLRLREMDRHWDKEQRRMETLWAEEERRRKSDRRRDLYDIDLKTVRDAVDIAVEALGKVQVLRWEAGADPESRGEVVINAVRVIDKTFPVVASLMDEELVKNYSELDTYFTEWYQLLDLNTGNAEKDKEEKFKEAKNQIRLAAAVIRRRIRVLLQEA